MANMHGLQDAVRTATSTTHQWQNDWRALFTIDSITEGNTWNEKMLKWINTELSTSYVGVTQALQEYAVAKGFTRFNSMNTTTGL